MIPKIFCTLVSDVTIFIYWTFYWEDITFAEFFSKYFIMDRFRTFTERNFKRTDWLLEIWWPFLSRLCESNTKQMFLCHMSAKLRPAQVNIAPLPMSSVERKSFGWANHYYWKCRWGENPIWLTSQNLLSLKIMVVHYRVLKTSLKCPLIKNKN